MSKNPIIVFEGIEGSGKTLHIKNVSRYLKKINRNFIQIREPGGSINYEKSYTFWNFIFCGLFLLYSGHKVRDYHAEFLLAYLYSLIPFFIINGVLTDGNFDFNHFTEPVVWYNNNENLFIRIITIPFEDLFYSMLLQTT